MKLELEIDFKKLGEELAKHDFVQVVRCKDCKYGRPYKHTNAYVACDVDLELVDKYKDFFCADGERRSE